MANKLILRPQMVVYAAEREAGLTELITNPPVVELASTAEFSEPFSISEPVLKSIATNIGQPDLRYLKSVLVTAGWDIDPERGVPFGMNLNDDFFEPVETFAARHTPEDKPVNDNHDCTYVIGHITSNDIVLADGTLLPNSVDADDIPNGKFQVVTGSVIYTLWDKPELQQRMDTILAEVDAGKRAVSMECMFSGFDYVVVEGGQAKAVARNSQTAFLTKHLRCYGGSGVYQEKRVGRLLRNMVFTGKGLVTKPANPESVIISSASVGEILLDEKQLGYSKMTEITEEKTESAKTMAQDNTEIDTLKAEKTQLEAGLKNKSEELTIAQAELVATKAKLDTTSEELVAAQAQLKIATDELDGIKAKAKQVERLVKVKSALKVDDTDPESVGIAEQFTKSLADISDEKFDSTVQAMSKIAPKTPKVTAAVLETAEVTPEPTMTVETDAGVENVRKSIAAMFGYETEQSA